MGARDRRDAEFTAFVHEHGDALLRTAHLLTGDGWKADDLVQLALTKTYLAWPAARAKVPYAYARKVLINCHIDMWRGRRWRESSTAPEDLPATPTSARWDEGIDQGVADRDAVERALALLTPRERAVFILRYGEDLSERGIADVLNIRVGTVKSLHSRGLARLRGPAAPSTGQRPVSPSLSNPQS